MPLKHGQALLGMTRNRWCGYRSSIDNDKGVSSRLNGSHFKYLPKVFVLATLDKHKDPFSKLISAYILVSTNIMTAFGRTTMKKSEIMFVFLKAFNT